MPLYQVLCISRHMPTYQPTKQLVSAVCTHLFQAGSTVRNIESWGYHVLPHIMTAHGQTHKNGDYWTLHFDTSPTTLQSLRHLLKHNQMVLRFTITKVASTIEQSAQEGRHLTLSHPHSNQAVRQKEFQPIKFSRGRGPGFVGFGQGQGQGRGQGHVNDGLDGERDVDDVDGSDGTGYTTLPDSPYRSPASPYSSSTTPTSIYSSSPSSSSSSSSDHQIDILESYMSAAQIDNTPEATLVDSPSRPGLKDMVRKESSKAWMAGGDEGASGAGNVEDWIFPSAPSQKPRPRSGSGTGGSGRKGRGSGIA